MATNLYRLGLNAYAARGAFVRRKRDVTDGVIFYFINETLSRAVFIVAVFGRQQSAADESGRIRRFREISSSFSETFARPVVVTKGYAGGVLETRISEERP